MEAITDTQKPRCSPELQITVSYMSSVTGAEGPGSPFCLKGNRHLQLLRNTKNRPCRAWNEEAFLIRINKVIVYGWVSWWHFWYVFILKLFPRLEAASFLHMNPKPDCETVHHPLLHHPFRSRLSTQGPATERGLPACMWSNTNPLSNVLCAKQNPWARL